jgi:hypothetical protein
MAKVPKKPLAPKPPNVQVAVLASNQPALSAMGKASARKRATRKKRLELVNRLRLVRQLRQDVGYATAHAIRNLDGCDEGYNPYDHT